MADKNLTIKTASEKYGQSPVYIRKAIRDKILPTKLVPIAEGSKTKQHVFTVEAYEAWRASRKSRSHRDDGRNKFALYANVESEIPAIKKAISKALPDFNVDDLLVRANQAKKS